MGAHDDVTVSLEALSLPGFFVSFASAGSANSGGGSSSSAKVGNEAVVQQFEQGRGPSGGGGSNGAAERGRLSLRSVMLGEEDGGAGWCPAHTFVMRAGLDGQELSVSEQMGGGLIAGGGSAPVGVSFSLFECGWGLVMG